ncbi:MAG: cysteine-rich small domain-containing protein [Clostridiales bacterium]|nr:cysteine-rich small domain-containing protein [Clostridiales bacterium]
MKNSYKYFQNTACEFFPCHEKTFDGFNCLFCYCPLYRFEKCLGNPKYIEYGDKKIKDCSNCTFPHRVENYEKMMAFFNENL